VSAVAARAVLEILAKGKVRSRMLRCVPLGARAGMILTPAALAGLAAVAGCSSAASSTVQPVAVPSAPISSAPPAAASSSAATADVPYSAPPTTSAGDGPAGLSAVLTMQDGQGDSYTQTFTFSSPEPESDVPDVINGVQTCQLGVAIAARNLVVPVQIATTLTTSVQTQIPIEMDLGQYDSDAANAGLPGDVVYQTSSGDLCATNEPGGDVTLSQGQTVTTQAWIVLQNAVTPAYPGGDSAQLGTNFIFFGYVGSGIVTSATGTAVCSGDPQTAQSDAPPYLVFAGQAPSGEGCNGTYSTSSSTSSSS
jgi:hypothetical protein